jgi:hypothetical protein
MPALEKHRDEKEVYSVSFDEKRLADGEALTGTPTVKLYTGSFKDGYTDVSSQFTITNITLADTNTDVQFTSAIATGTNQAAGVYLGKITCGTTNSRTVVQTFTLTVSDRGSTTS